MDTRQLAAFCAVIERRSFSRAADQLGVTQPAVSLQVQALEKRLGTQLIDRSGRRVEPTEAGERLFRGARKLLALEHEVLDSVIGEGDTELAGVLAIGASTGPAHVILPLLLCEFQSEHPAVRIRFEVHDTQTVVELVGERQLELGIVGAARRRRGVRYQPFMRDEVILVCPIAHPFAGRTVTLDELRRDPPIVMQQGAGVRQVLEDELRRLGTKLRDLDPPLQLGLQESVRSAVLAGHGVAFVSRRAVEADLSAGRLAEAQLDGMTGGREISLARPTGHTLTRVAEAFAAFSRDRIAW